MERTIAFSRNVFRNFVLVSLPLTLTSFFCVYILNDKLMGTWHHLNFIEPLLTWSAFILIFVGFLLYATKWIILRAMWTENDYLFKCSNWLLKISIFATGVSFGFLLLSIFLCTTRHSETILVNTASQYKHNRAMTEKMDTIHKKLECCGIWSYLDWTHAEDLDLNSNIVMEESCELPKSCVRYKEEYHDLSPQNGCRKLSQDLKNVSTATKNRRRVKNNSLNSVDDVIYTTGCLWKVMEFQQMFGQFLFTYTFLLALIEVIGLKAVNKSLASVEEAGVSSDKFMVRPVKNVTMIKYTNGDFLHGLGTSNQKIKTAV